MAYHFVTWYDTPSHPCHTYIYYCKPIKKKYTWMSLHMCHGMMPISIYAMPWHSCMKQPFFGHLKIFLLSSVIFIIFNFFLHSNYILVSIHNRLANLFWKFKWKLLCSIVVYSHFSQSVSQSGLRLVKNSWTCDDPKFQCSPKQFHTKRPDLVPTHTHTYIYNTHSKRRRAEIVELVGKMFLKVHVYKA